MLRILSILYASAAFGLAISPVAQAAESRVPSELAAKRAALPQEGRATPSPLEMLFTPISACRAFGQIKILAGQASIFQITGNTNFGGQGGPPTGCGIPAAARAVSISLSALSASKGGLTAFAQGTAKPVASMLSYSPNELTTAGATIPLGSNGKMKVFSKQTATVFGDVTGYYLPQIWAYVGSTGALIDSSPRIVSSTNTGTGDYTVVVDRDVSTCAATASSDLTGHIMSAYTSGSNVYVYSVNNAGTKDNYWFNLHVMC